MEAWYASALGIEESFTGAVDTQVHVFVADVVISFDTDDRRILGRALSSLGPPACFRHAYFEYHALFDFGYGLLLGQVMHGPGMEAFHRDAT